MLGFEAGSVCGRLLMLVYVGMVCKCIHEQRSYVSATCLLSRKDYTNGIVLGNASQKPLSPMIHAKQSNRPTWSLPSGSGGSGALEIHPDGPCLADRMAEGVWNSVQTIPAIDLIAPLV